MPARVRPTVTGNQEIDRFSREVAAALVSLSASSTATAADATVVKLVRVATTASVTLNGTQTIDGVSVRAGDRVLVKDHSSGARNGVFVASTGAWTRAEDADSSDDVQPMTLIAVSEGSANGGKLFKLTTPAPITLGTTALTFTELTSTASGGGFTTQYEVDFTSLATQNLITGGDGSKTIDGKTWDSVSGTANATTLGITNGVGLVLKKTTTAGGIPLMKTKLSQLASISPWSDSVEVWVRVTYSDVGTGSPGVAVNQCAVEMRAEESASAFTPNLQYFRAQVESSATTQVKRKFYINYKNTDESQPTVNIEASYLDVVVFRLVGPNMWTIELGAYSGGWPTPQSLTFFGMCFFADVVTSPPVSNTNMNPADLAIQFFVFSSGAFQPQATITHLRIRTK